MKHLFIVNPVAGGKDASAMVRAKVEAAFADREDEFEVYVTKCPMDAPEKVRAEAEKGEHLRVYACGGDGTFNECVCGAAQRENVAVAPFPTGTGNDFCRMFGEEKDAFRDLDALLRGWEHSIDLIDCNGRWCDNIASVGIDARIGCDVHKYSKLPVIGSAAGYVVSLIVNFFKGLCSEMSIRVGEEYRAEGRHALVCACNGRFYGGGFNPSADARPDDGELDIFVIDKVNLLQAAGAIGKYSSGKADELPQLIRHFRGTEVEITLARPDVVNIDGEAEVSDHVVFRLVPRAARLIVPATLHFFDDRKPLEA